MNTEAVRAIKIFEGAKKELKRRGLNKGDFFASGPITGEPIPPDEPCCLVGACMAASGQKVVSSNHLGDRLYGYLDAAAPQDLKYTCWEYNDLRTTNRTHLYALLDRAIALAKKDVAAVGELARWIRRGVK